MLDFLKQCHEQCCNAWLSDIDLVVRTLEYRWLNGWFISESYKPSNEASEYFPPIWNEMGTPCMRHLENSNELVLPRMCYVTYELQIWIDNNSKVPDHIRTANCFIQKTILMLRIAVAEVEYCALWKWDGKLPCMRPFENSNELVLQIICREYGYVSV